MKKNQWDKIISEAFSSDAPEPQFSKAYQRRKKEILHQAESSAERNVTMNQSKIGFAFTCTASLALAGLAVWGGVNLYQAGHNSLAVKTETFNPAEAVEMTETEPPTEVAKAIYQEETPEDDFKISVEQTGDIVNLSIPVEENDTLYEVKFGYVPEGLECREDGPYALKYHNYENENDAHAITPDLCRVADPSEPYTNTYDTVYEVDKFQTSSGNSAVFLKRSRGWDRLIVQFEGTPYIESCFIKGFSDEEMHQLADEMYLEETDKEKAGLWQGAPNLQENFDYDVIFQCEEGSETMGNYKLAFGWKPEDLSYQTDNTGEGAWNEICIPGENTDDTINTRRNVGYVLYRVEDTSKPFLWTELDVTDAQKMTTTDGNDVIYVTYDNSSAVDARFYVHFKNSPYIAELVTRKLSEKEYLRLVNSLCLEETEEQYFTVYHAQDEAEADTSSDETFNYEVMFQCEEGSDNMGNYELSFGWTPQDISFQTVTYLNATWNEFRNTRRSLSYTLYRVEDVSQPFISYEPYATDAEKTITVDGEENDVIWCNFESDSPIDRKIYIHFKNSPYIAELWTVKLTDDECFNIINNLSLTETEEQNFTVYHTSQEEIIASE